MCNLLKTQLIIIRGLPLTRCQNLVPQISNGSCGYMDVDVDVDVDVNVQSRMLLLTGCSVVWLGSQIPASQSTRQLWRFLLFSFTMCYVFLAFVILLRFFFLTEPFRLFRSVI